MPIINSILFSMNRALQLDAVLRSFFMHCGDADGVQMNVLYLAADDAYARQYQDLMKAHPAVNFIAQENFRRDTLSILNPFAGGDGAEKAYFRLCAIGGMGFPPGSLLDRVWRRTFGYIQRSLTKSFMPPLDENKYILFLVDDNIFTRAFSLADAIKALEGQEDLIGFSLRLGKNITHCYVNDQPQTAPAFVPVNEKVLKFDWTSSEQDFGYPMEVSSSLYRLKDILPFVIGLPFENPNVLEDRMAFHAGVFRSSRPFLGCYQNSVTFCNPVNMVQSVIRNRVGDDLRYGVDALKKRFEQGERIRVEAYKGFIPSACHQEIELVFGKVEEQ